MSTSLFPFIRSPVGPKTGQPHSSTKGKGPLSSLSGTGPVTGLDDLTGRSRVSDQKYPTSTTDRRHWKKGIVYREGVTRYFSLLVILPSSLSPPSRRPLRPGV